MEESEETISFAILSHVLLRFHAYEICGFSFLSFSAMRTRRGSV